MHTNFNECYETYISRPNAVFQSSREFFSNFQNISFRSGVRKLAFFFFCGLIASLVRPVAAIPTNVLRGQF